MSRLVKGRVVRVDAKVCHVETGDGVFLAAPRGALFDKLDAATKEFSNSKSVSCAGMTGYG